MQDVVDRAWNVHELADICADEVEVVVADQVGQPTWTVDLAEGIVRIVEAGAPFGDDGMPPHVDVVPVVFGLRHTDGNQHVNSLVYPRLVEEAGKLAQAGGGNGFQRLQEMLRIDAVEAVRQVVAAGSKVERGAHGGNAGDQFGFNAPRRAGASGQRQRASVALIDLPRSSRQSRCAVPVVRARPGPSRHA